MLWKGVAVVGVLIGAWFLFRPTTEEELAAMREKNRRWLEENPEMARTLAIATLSTTPLLVINTPNSPVPPVSTTPRPSVH